MNGTNGLQSNNQRSTVFPQIAFAIGVLTSSLGVSDRGISGFVAGGRGSSGV